MIIFARVFIKYVTRMKDKIWECNMYENMLTSCLIILHTDFIHVCVPIDTNVEH